MLYSNPEAPHVGLAKYMMDHLQILLQMEMVFLPIYVKNPVLPAFLLMIQIK